MARPNSKFHSFTKNLVSYVCKTLVKDTRKQKIFPISKKFYDILFFAILFPDRVSQEGNIGNLKLAPISNFLKMSSMSENGEIFEKKGPEKNMKDMRKPSTN